MTDVLEQPVHPVPATGVWRTAPWFLLRLTGLPIEDLQRLRFGATTAWADQVLQTRRDLAGRAPDLAEVLARYIATADGARRGALVALRRDIFNGRLPRRPAAVRALVRECPPELAGPLLAWLEDRQRLADLIGTGPAVLATETGERRENLRDLARDERFRAGLVFASASLDTYLDGYLRSGDTMTKRSRRIERSLLEYVYRTAAKTSPFSTFTGMAAARFDDDADGILTGTVDDAWEGFARVNIAVATRLLLAVLDDPALLSGLSVRLTPGWSAEYGRIRFVRRTVTLGDDDASVTFDTVRDSLFFLERNGVLGETVALLERAGVVRVPELVTALTELTGAGADTCREWVRLLVRIGLLWTPDLQVDPHARDPLQAFATALRGLGQDWSDAAAAPLGAAAERIRRCDFDLPARRSLTRDVRALLTEAFTAVGAPDASLPQTLVFEDTRASAAVALAGRQRWETRLAPALHQICDILPAFDLSLPHRLVLKSFFKARFGAGGRCDDVLRFLHEFDEDIYAEYNRVSGRKPTYTADGVFTGHENWLGDPALEAVNAARSRFGEEMRRLWDARGEDATTLQIPQSLVDEVAGLLAPLAGSVRPQGFFAQLAGTEEAPEIVLNKAMSGLSFAFSRFTHCFGTMDGASLAERVREATRALLPEGAVLAEIVGGVVNSNLNLHDRMTDYHLVCPAEASSFPVQDQLHVEDLYLVHEPATDRLVLRSRRLRREVIPAYLGYLMPTALPEVARGLLLLSPMGMSLLDLWGAVPSPTGDRVSRPRVAFRNIVLGRRSWSVPSSELPVRAPEDDEAGVFLAWRAWQAEHQLPDQVFVTFPTESDAGPEGDDADGGEGGGWVQRTKPMYLDFTSLFSLTLLETQARRAEGRVQFEEMYPSEEDLYVRSSRGRHVCELAIESARIPVQPEEL